MRRIYIKIEDSASDVIGLKVQNVTVADATAAVSIDWEEILGYGIEVYEVWRKEAAGAWSKITEISSDEYGLFAIDVNVSEGVLYTYRVRAKNNVGKYTEYSNEAAITLEPSVVFAAPSISVEVVSNGLRTTWAPNLDNTITANYYEFEKIKDNGEPTIEGPFAGAGGSAIDMLVEEGSTYKYRARGYNSEYGYTEWSNQVTKIFTNAQGSTYPRNFQKQFTVQGATHNNKIVGIDIYVPSVPITPGFPYLVFCHGAGENSNINNEPDYARLRSGSGYAKLVAENIGGVPTYEFPYIVISPQLPRYQNAWSAELIDEVIASVKEEIAEINENRVAIAGWSNGKAAWIYPRENPVKTSVCIPFAVAGENPNSTNACATLAGDTAFWVFHNNGDGIVGSGGSIQGFDALKACGTGTRVYMSLGSGSSHDCVDPVLKGQNFPVVADSKYRAYPDAGYTIHDFIVDNY